MHTGHLPPLRSPSHSREEKKGADKEEKSMLISVFLILFSSARGSFFF